MKCVKKIDIFFIDENFLYKTDRLMQHLFNSYVFLLKT